MQKVPARLVVLDVLFDPQGSDYDEETAVYHAFGETEGTTLRQKGSAMKYTSANFEGVEDPDCWVGVMYRTKRRGGIEFQRESDGRVRSQARGAVDGVEGKTYYAYFPQSSAFVVWETGNIPYTRFQSYLREILRRDELKFSLQLEPRRADRTINEALRDFDRVDTVTLQFRHSQSPGNEIIDMMVEQLNLRDGRMIYRAEEGGLNVDRLTDPQHFEGKTIEHLEVNPKNGSSRINGETKGIRWAWEMGSQVLHTFTEVAPTPVALARAAQDLILAEPPVRLNLNETPEPPEPRR